MVYIIGHGGAPSPDAPENTIESFEKAIEIFKTAAVSAFIELDIHLSKDGKMVVIHGSDLTEATEGSVRGYVREFTLRKLQNIMIWGGSRIPTLRKVLELNFPVMIELKAGQNDKIYPNLVGKAVKLLEDLKFTKEVIFISFYPEYLIELKKFPRFKKMFLSKTFPDLGSLKDFGLYGLGIRYNSLNQENIRLAHEKGLKVFAWTVNREDDIREVIDWGVDYICSDDPVLVKKIAAEK